jgi:hypothetical protein
LARRGAVVVGSQKSPPPPPQKVQTGGEKTVVSTSVPRVTDLIASGFTLRAFLVLFAAYSSIRKQRKQHDQISQ